MIDILDPLAGTYWHKPAFRIGELSRPDPPAAEPKQDCEPGGVAAPNSAAVTTPDLCAA